MITSRPSFGLLLATSFLVAGPFFQLSTAHAAGKQSLLAQAATGQWTDGDPQVERAPLDEPIVRPVGFFDPYGSSCGPVCDCGHCDAGCGAEGVFSETPGCGLEVACGFEMGSGFEVGCGVGGCEGCGNAGCAGGCYESVCGNEGAYLEGPVCGMEITGDCSCDACTGCDSGQTSFCVPKLRINWCNIDFMWGHQGYTGPLNYVSISEDNNDRSGNGSFGLYQGFNKGTSLRRWLGCNVASQLGVRTTQSNLSSSGYTRERRYQVFLTAGLFRRVDYGLQCGLVLDYLNQDWYFQSNALQMRGELSWRCDSCETFGFQFMAGVRNESSGTVVFDGDGNTLISTIRMEPTDQARLFYRRQLARNGEFTGYAGWTDRDDALLGTNISIPILRRFLLATDLTYLIPKQGRSSGGNEQESWNASIGFIFRPGGSRGYQRYNRPMFNVADNGTFLMDRR